MLIAAGSLIFAIYLYKVFRKSFEKKEEQGFGGVFFIIGLIASFFGLGLYFSEPIPAQYIEIYGVGYLVFTLLMIIGGLSLMFNWNEKPASYLAVIGGIMLLGSAYTVFSFSLSKSPFSTALMFGLSGLGSISSIILTHSTKRLKVLEWLVILIFVAVGLLTLYSGLHAQYGHVASTLAAK